MLANAALRGSLVCVTFAVALLTSRGRAQNDECNGALPIGGWTIVSASICSPSEPQPLCTYGNDLWYSFVPTISGPHAVRVSAFGGLGVGVEVLTGACGQLAVVACEAGLQNGYDHDAYTVPSLLAGEACLIRVIFMATVANAYLFVVPGTDDGVIEPAGPACGTASLLIQGYPAIGETLTATMLNWTGAPFVGLGFANPGMSLQPFGCPQCRLGCDWSVAMFGASYGLAVPLQPGFLGAQLFWQGADLFAPSGCASLQTAFTESWLTAIG